ncbi:acetyltransferase (plasmid) [Halobaculum sp. CBA1158]|uniref:N-acetyltransferase n=1 Tax=Halobaculum sp. CBA1158 TaxID=2904243 RepID=UPI001F3E3ECD|nr:acyltransferase [Halobaculum sp. CBA1158]UIP01523.1 acetyltransferase [Halobaculum sp. CBA1158]
MTPGRTDAHGHGRARSDGGSRGARIDPGATLKRVDGTGPTLGADATVREGTVVYADVVAGDGLSTGHHAVIREGTRLGDDVLVGTHAVLDGDCTVGDGVSIQTGAYCPTGTRLGDRAFLGPHAVLTNDRYPLRTDEGLDAPTVEADASVGANATVLPGVTVGEGAFVAADALVAEDVPPRTLAVGSPAEHRPLPDPLQGVNDA